MYTIETLEILRGALPRRVHGMVVEWATLYRQELRLNWERAVSRQPLDAIDPLD